MPDFSACNPWATHGAPIPPGQMDAARPSRQESGPRHDNGVGGQFELDHGEKNYRGMARLIGRKALVIGADTGIGRAVAIAYAREGADLVMNYLPDGERHARDVLALIRAEGHRAIAIPGDLRDQAFCLELVQRTHEALGGIDVLANAACAVAPVDGDAVRDDDIPFRAHLYAMFWLCRAILPLMPPGAAIINTAEILPCRDDGVARDDASTQAAILAFTGALVRQAAARGVRVNLVRPGPMWTPAKTDGAQPADLAALYVLLASRDNNLLSGEIYGVSGGMPDALAPR